MTTTGTYDEALGRFLATGPEYDGYLSNHGPMVVEALNPRGSGHHVHTWADAYLRRLDERPRGIRPVEPGQWREALGDRTRTGDWIALMLAQTREET